VSAEPVRKLIYSMTVSLDGFIAGPSGEIDWSAPNDELFRFHTEQTRELGAVVCGRGLYEAMLVWETAEQTWSDPTMLEFARVWRPIPKVVCSRTLVRVDGNARLATGGIADEIGALKSQPGKVVSIGGAGLAAAAIELDLVDEYRLFVRPVVLGGGTPFFPPLAQRLELELIETRTFAFQVIYMRYARTRA
jgi:dihydrofolate reductase